MTVQGPVKKPQRDGMSHAGGGGGVPTSPSHPPGPNPLKYSAEFSSGPSGDQTVSLVPSVPIGLDQKRSSAPLKPQHLRRGPRPPPPRRRVVRLCSLDDRDDDCASLSDLHPLNYRLRDSRPMGFALLRGRCGRGYTQAGPPPHRRVGRSWQWTTLIRDSEGFPECLRVSGASSALPRPQTPPKEHQDGPRGYSQQKQRSAQCPPPPPKGRPVHNKSNGHRCRGSPTGPA